MRRSRQRGMTLIELVVAFTIMMTLSAMAVPLARSKVRAERERELRYDLRDMHLAIDKYKDMCDAGYFGPDQGRNRLLPGNARHPGGRHQTARSRWEEAVSAAARFRWTRSRTARNGACAAIRTNPSRKAGADKTYSTCIARQRRKRPMAPTIPIGNVAFCASLLRRGAASRSSR